MTVDKMDSIAKDTILYADKKNYICLLKRYSYDKMTISGFMKGFYRIYHDGYRKWMRTSENFKELMLLDVNSKAIGFDSQVLKYWDHALEEVADDIRNSTFTAKRELAFRGWIIIYRMEIYATVQDPSKKPNIFDTRQPFLGKMHDPKLFTEFLDSF